ncbi:MAG: SsrA-binding protein [Planctomycetota bacterium]|nr:MAG: SsrA-binding protein [Planctomycetota bacterium]
MPPPEKSNKKLTIKIATNRKAKHDFHIIESLEVGIELKGVEVKSLRANKLTMEDAFADIIDNQIWLKQLHISLYENAGHEIVDPLRKRKLLLHKSEIIKLAKKIKLNGYTLIPLDVHFNGPWAKITLGLCQGKKQHDKRDDLKKKSDLRDMQRSSKNRF